MVPLNLMRYDGNVKRLHKKLLALAGGFLL
nr:MAG TPA: hypothetical protein [Caudoviricetes sp.]DAQ57025.1 MAG TPA: hypothetical protein [Caudoviricetes sp.]DAX87930.1 MAG TPA: hypothetical protein [Caudoviricetes sp.]